ncbi:MAG: AAA family ATPase [Deltaproteobacteria bacterium]|nr:AAA family ATPase [Deltaproteobacteria bacterium]
MGGVISEIIGWAGWKLKYWEKLALYKIMAGETLDDQAFKELLRHLLIDNGLFPVETDRPDISFDMFDKQADLSATSTLHICEIKNLQNVNALVSGQCLPFGPALTVVFGANGSGKSGYARILGCAGFIRGEVDVFPNINEPGCSNLTPVAEIEIQSDSGRQCISYSPNQECIELNSLHVFDVKSVQEHLIKKNTFTFSPAGLSHLTKLAEVTDTVRERLAALVDAQSKAQDFTPLFQGGNSPIKEMVTGLNARTDLNALQEASKLTDVDKTKMAELDKKIAELKTKNIPKQIAALEKTKSDLDGLRDKIINHSEKLSDEVVKSVSNSIDEFKKADSFSKKIGIDQFKTEFFTHTGTQTWYDFVKAAKSLAEEEQAEDKPYPQDDDRCLFCHQPLSIEARELILKLWQFLEGEAQAALTKATRNLNSIKQKLGGMRLDFFSDQAVSYRYLDEYDKAKESKIVEIIIKFIEACRIRIKTLSEMIDDKDVKASVVDLSENGSDLIASVNEDLDKQLEKLRDSDPAKEIEKLEIELRTLTHKKVLGDQFSEITKYVNRLAWAEAAFKAGGSTRPITLKYNALFEDIVTGGYLRLFQDMLSHLGRPIRVKVDTTPRKGVTFKQIMLETDSDSLPPGANPDTVLSEGEKRAVALADFLTEVALDIGSGGIVLDDPVTSLDLEWSAVIASLIVNEAKKRQVVVFTHNLPFVHCLKNYCQDMNVDAQMHWIKRGDNDDKPGYVFANNSPALESDYKTTHIANEHYKKAKELPPAEQELELKQGFGALRTTYESFIIYSLLGGVVIRFNERISPGRLKDVVWDGDLFQRVIDKHESLSKYIEGHLHSDAYVPVKPTREMLIQEINEFDEIKKKHRQLASARR